MAQNSPNIFRYGFAFLFPFWSAIASLKFFKSPSARNLFWYGCVFMGFIHIFNPIGGSQSDGVRYAEALVNIDTQRIDANVIKSYFYSQDGSLDIYQPLVTLFVSAFTKDPHFLFLIFAIVFGFFYSRNIWIVLNLSKKETLSWWVWIVLIMMLLVNPIWEINGVRMWTALHVFVYGVLSFYINNDKKKLLWSFASIFIHFSFVFPLILILIFQFLPKNKLTIFFVVYFITAAFNEINLQSLNDSLTNILPSQLSSRTNSYLNEDYLMTVNETNASYSQYLIIAKYLSKYFILTMVVYFWINKNSLFTNKFYQELLALFLFMSAAFQLVSVIPSMGRFFRVTDIIFYALLFLLLIDQHINNLEFNTFVKYLSLMLVLPILLTIRLGFEFYGTSLFWGNFVSAYFLDDRMPAITYIKSMF